MKTIKTLMGMSKPRCLKASLLIMTLLLVSLMLAACMSRDTGIKLPQEGDPGTITVVDCMGRTVTVPENPTWVAPIFAPSSHLVAMLGDSEKIVAVATGNMRDTLFLEIYPFIKNARTPKGGGDTGVNVEELFSSPVPEIIFCDSAMLLDTKMVERIEKFGIPLVAITFRSVEEQKYAIHLVGEIMGREEKAQAFCDYYDEVLEYAEERTSDIKEEDKKAVYHSINELLRAEATNSLPGEWMPRIGIKMVGAAEVDEASDSKNRISLEQFLEYDPSFIIINGEDVYDYIQLSERLHVLTAYKTNNIYLLPYGITRFAHTYSLETPLAILWVAKTVYPERFTDLDMNVEIKKFYKQFFDTELNDEEVEQILSGRGLRTVKSRETPL